MFCSHCKKRKAIHSKILNRETKQEKKYHNQCLKKLFKKCKRCELFIDYNCQCIKNPCKDCGINMFEFPEEQCTGCYMKQRIREKTTINTYAKAI